MTRITLSRKKKRKIPGTTEMKHLININQGSGKPVANHKFTFLGTTAPHVVSIHSGCPVGESGIYEWYMYDPKLDSIISPLLFNFAGSEERNTLQNAGLQPEELFPPRSLYKELKTENITSFVYQSRDYTPSPVTEAAFEGTQVLPFTIHRE